MTYSVDTVLLVAALSLALTSLAAAATLLLHGAFRMLYRRRMGPRIAAARSELTAILLSPAHRAADTPALRTLPARQRTRLVMQHSRTLTGAGLEPLRRIAHELGVVERARADLASRFWWRRLRGARVIQVVDPESREYLKLLDDDSPAVRVQAVEWAGDHREEEVAEALLQRLGRVDVLSQFAVQDALLRIGAAAVPALARFLTAAPRAAILPALEVAAAMAHPSFAPAATSLTGDADADVRAIAAQLLGAAVGSQAAAVLTPLLSDPDPRVRAAAAEALGRAGHWPAAAAVARLLRDSAWDVRRAGGLALRRLESPGELLLRHYLSDTDPFAADMARQVLDLPAGVLPAK